MELGAVTVLTFLALFAVFTFVLGHLCAHAVASSWSTSLLVIRAWCPQRTFFLNVGFYLLCLGMALVNLAAETSVADVGSAIRAIAFRLGVCIVVVAVLHTVNLAVLALLLRRTSRGGAIDAN
jgi:hypothetical protein